MKDQPYQVRLSEEITVSSSSVSEEDFNSEDAFCATMSSGEQGPSEVKIVGMDLLFSDEQFEEDCTDDSETDSSEEEFNGQQKLTVDSIELTRKRLSAESEKHDRHRKNQGSRRVYFPYDEVDSLILARERLPHMIHRNLTEDTVFLIRLFEEGRGLMGEVDSLELDKERLPHLIHVRRGHVLLPQQRALELLDSKGSSKVDSDSESTSSNESTTSSKTGFTVATVDSLILAKRRFASHARHPCNGLKSGSGDVHQQSKPSTGTTGETSKLPEKPGIGLGPGLCRQSSSACAA